MRIFIDHSLLRWSLIYLYFIRIFFCVWWDLFGIAPNYNSLIITRNNVSTDIFVMKFKISNLRNKVMLFTRYKSSWGAITRANLETVKSNIIKETKRVWNKKKDFILVCSRLFVHFGMVFLMPYQPLWGILCQSHPFRSTVVVLFNYSWEDKGAHTFLKGISLEMKLIAD